MILSHYVTYYYDIVKLGAGRLLYMNDEKIIIKYKEHEPRQYKNGKKRTILNNTGNSIAIN